MVTETKRSPAVISRNVDLVLSPGNSSVTCRVPSMSVAQGRGHLKMVSLLLVSLENVSFPLASL